MKLLTKIFIVFSIVCLIAVVWLQAFVSVRAKELLTKKMKSAFGEDVRIGSVTAVFPLNLVVKDIEVKNWFTIKEVFAARGLIDLLGKDLILPELRLRGLAIVLERQKNETQAADVPRVPEAGTQGAEPPKATGNTVSEGNRNEDLALPGRVVLKRLRISDSQVKFVDHTAGEPPLVLNVKDLNVAAENIVWPVRSASVVFFKLNGAIPWNNMPEQGRLRCDGWINPLSKDMRATIEISDIDAIQLSPYYADWIDIEKAKVAKAKLNFSSTITALKNDANAVCHLELTQVEFKQRPEQEEASRFEKITQAVLGMLKALNEGKIVLDFTFKTKLDNPEFGLGVIRAAFNDKLKEARKGSQSSPEKLIQLPGKIIGGTITGATDLTKSVINGTVNVGKEIKKAIDVSFDRQAYTNKTAEVETLSPPAPVNQTIGLTNSTNSTQ